MKTLICTIAALFISVVSINAQEKADVKADQATKKVVVKKVVNADETYDANQPAKTVEKKKVVVKKTDDAAAKRTPGKALTEDSDVQAAKQSTKKKVIKKKIDN